MTAEQKKFWLEEVCPFILREQGRGFAMTDWQENVEHIGNFWADGLVRKTPSCGTVACIGGTCHMLLAKRPKLKDISNNTEDIAEHIGLSVDKANGLFMNWDTDDYIMPASGYCWPERFRKRYQAAKTPLAKAKIAVALIKEVVKTDGECLETI